MFDVPVPPAKSSTPQTRKKLHTAKIRVDVSDT